MPFTDQQLAAAMSQELVNAGVMTAQERDALLEDPTENNVRDTLTANQLANFQAYWNALGQWMAANGGNIATTSGNNVPGRVGGNPVGLALKAVYNDAFRDVNAHIGTPGFLPVKAVSNQLRFISVINDN
ncbi:MAG: hypothetical protein AB1489_38885 [Acidobacteriota bacterium]